MCAPETSSELKRSRSPCAPVWMPAVRSSATHASRLFPAAIPASGVASRSGSTTGSGSASTVKGPVTRTFPFSTSGRSHSVSSRGGTPLAMSPSFTCGTVL